MHILFVSPYPPSRIRIRSYGFIQQLAATHEVSVLALAGDPPETQDAHDLQRDGVHVTLVEEPRWRRVTRSVCALPGRVPLQVAYANAPSMRAELAAVLRSRRVDVLHVESLRGVGMLPEALPVPAVWDAVDCITRLYDLAAKVGATRPIRIIGHLEAGRTRVYERRQLERFRHVLVTSERDRQALLELLEQPAGVSPRDRHGSSAGPTAEIAVLPHGVDRAYYSTYAGARDPATLVFSGKMSYHANVAGVVSFVERVLPRIWARRPDVRFVIAGKDPPAAIRRLSTDARIVVTGYVPDLRPSIGRARVAISPLPYAVGIQNKVLEAMALGTPTVATSAAASGLQTVPGRDLLVADGPADFAEAVLRLLDDHDLWRQLSEHGTRYVAEHHDWAVVTAALVGVYERLVTRAAAETQRARAY